MQSIPLGDCKESWNSENRNLVEPFALEEERSNVSKDEVSCAFGRCVEFTAKIRGILVI